MAPDEVSTTICPLLLGGFESRGKDYGMTEDITIAQSDSAADVQQSQTVPSEDPILLRKTRASEPHKHLWRVLIAPGWFSLGVLVGLIGFALLQQLIPKPTLDAATVRSAARDGALDAIATLQAPNRSKQTQREDTPVPIPKDVLVVRDANRLGDRNTQVTIVEFGDFQCPFCGRFHKTTSWTLLDQYVKTGKANFVYKHMAFLGLESIWAAIASECAADQGKFWKYHDLLFERQNGENQGAFTKNKLLGFATELQLDMNRFEPCLRNDLTLERVRQDTEEGQKFGVNSTPTFFVNGQRLVGSLPLKDFEELIDKILAH